VAGGDKRLTGTLRRRISDRNAVIAVIGVGYIGFPLAIKLTEKLFQVIGVDVNHEVVSALKSGNSTVEGISNERLRAALRNGLKIIGVNKKEPANTSARILGDLLGVDVFLVCVPTPLDKTKELEPDTSHIESAAAFIDKICVLERQRKKLPKERLLVLESTTYPGTTRRFFSPLLEKYARNSKRWYLAYSPERTSPGPRAFDETEGPTPPKKRSGEDNYPPTFKITRIIGGKDRASGGLGATLYRTVFDDVRTVQSLEAAEMIKLVENTFRFTAIAFANEIARAAKTLGLDVWEIIDAARTKRFGFELCFPGLIGGHCLPIDPHYLGWTVRNRRVAATFVDVAENEHQNMRREAFDLIQRLLNQRNKGIAGASVLFLGVAYKKNVADIRESAAIKLMEKLHESGATVIFWDPVRAKHPAKPPIRLFFTNEQCKTLPSKVAARLKLDREKARYYSEPKEIKGSWSRIKNRVLSLAYSCIVVASDHDEFRLAYRDLIMSKDGPPVADLCNAINWWLRDAEIQANDRRRIMLKLADRRNYMLLGLH
jgi:UDP-N-acetyl-D-glucosamine dehydrogenase